jgi:DNA-directed RNA polymerase subunit RPC12/RpoP
MSASQMEFFRHCPNCGRRFHIKLQSKEMTHMDREMIPRETAVRYGGTGPYVIGPEYLSLQEGAPVIVDREEFRYAYKCNHCGHAWSEKHVEERKEKR